jgi:FkbM family methyltransferase
LYFTKIVHFWGPFKYLIQELWEKKYHSYSQLKQDLEVLQHYGFKRNGYFVDVGANDGILLSNTFLLEKGYGWHGICIEPIPNIFNELVFRRPGSHNVQKACYSNNNQRIVFSVTKDNLFSGITSSINCHKSALEGSQEIIVDTITLETVLMENNAPLFIEYLSLDTEGSELEILLSMNWDKYSFGIIHVEHNFMEPQRTQIREFLESKQYVFIRENKWDDVFHHPTLSKKNNKDSSG